MRARFARWLVRLVADAIDTAYKANCLGHVESEKYWTGVFIVRTRLYLPIARFVDREAMIDQLIEEGWWG